MKNIQTTFKDQMNINVVGYQITKKINENVC